MTADERIERLLNRFGQTIADLPKADGMHHVYEDEHRKSAKIAVRAWHKVDPADLIDIVDLLDMYASYICHLADIIDRMETALETAVRWSSCFTCARFVKEFPKCKAKYWDGCYSMSDSCFIDDDVEVKDEDG